MAIWLRQLQQQLQLQQQQLQHQQQEILEQQQQNKMLTLALQQQLALASSLAATDFL